MPTPNATGTLKPVQEAQSSSALETFTWRTASTATTTTWRSESVELDDLLHNCRVCYWKVLSWNLSLMCICFTRCMMATAPVLLRWPNCVEIRFLLPSAPRERTCTWSYVQTASSTQADFWLTTKPVSDTEHPGPLSPENPEKKSINIVVTLYFKVQFSLLTTTFTSINF